MAALVTEMVSLTATFNGIHGDDEVSPCAPPAGPVEDHI